MTRRSIGVYRIVNTQDGTCYIGSTSQSFVKRWNHHRSHLRNGTHSNGHLQRAWNKYGSDVFVFEVVEVLSDCIIAREQYWIDNLRNNGEKLYNLAVTAGNPMQGRKHSIDTRKRISKSNTGKKRSEDTKRRIGDVNRGKPNTDAQKQKISAKLRGRKFTDIHRERMRLSSGHEQSEATKKKISDTQSGTYPALWHEATGVIIPAGKNITSMCKRHGLNTRGVHQLVAGTWKQYKGWTIFQG